MPKIEPVPTQLVSIGKPSTTTRVRPGGWFSGQGRRVADARERLGYSQAAQTSSLYQSPESHYSFYRAYRSLMPAQYWSLYKQSPDVRSCIDSIVRRIATWDWFVKPTIDPRDADEYRRLTDEAARVADFLRVPNKDGQTWQELMTATVTDLLVYDSGILELVDDSENALSELVSWLGSEWFAVVDTHGRLLRYDQTPENSNEPPVEVAPDKICAFKLYTNNRSTNGLPLLESCITECLTVLLSSEHAMLALDADEIPPGLLVLGGVAGAAAERARADLQQMRGRDHRIRVVTSPEPAGIEAKWVELRHSVRDLELLQVVDAMRHAIWRVFGVSPVELGESTGTPRAAAEVQMDVASSHLISPILEMIQARVNAQILPRLLDEADVGRVQFGFERGASLSATERLATAQRSEVLLRRGVVTVNEVRGELGLLPIEGGDVATVETNMGPIPLVAVASGQAPALTMPGTQYSDGDFPSAYERAQTRSKLDDLSKTVADNLRARAREHNEAMKGRASWRRTNAGVLAEVYDRGVGAYHSNPESVRPGVASAEQWGYGRVDSFLYALDRDKFKRGEHDTDLLPREHPLSTKGDERAVVARVPSFERAPLDTAWGWNERQRERLLGDPPDWRRFARAHLWNDGSGDERFDAFKFPIARVVRADDDEPQIVFRGVASVVGALNEDGKHESLDGVSLAEQREIYALVRRLYEQFGQEPPVVARLEDERALRAVGDVDPTNFPAAGDDDEVSLANSQWEIFDVEYAKDLRENYPEIWRAGGNVRGNSQWRKLLPIVERGGSMKPRNDSEEGAIRLREAWVARHEGDFRLAGVVAQIKWIAVGSRGERYMKELVDEQKAKIDAERSKHEHSHACGPDCSHSSHEHSLSHWRTRLRPLHSLTRRDEIERAAAQTWLPSEWQPASKFDDVRTLNLPDLADSIAAYTRTAARLYADAASEVEATLRAAFGSSATLTVQRANDAQRRVDDTLDALAAKWDAAGREHYRAAAQNGAKSAERASERSSVSSADVDTTADAYAVEAMQYLVDEQGLVGTLREQLRRLVQNASTPQTRTKGVDTLVDEITDEASRAEVLATSSAVFAANAHRVTNWTGKLVGLANRVLASTLESVVAVETDRLGESRAVVWYYEWVSAGGRSCPICADEGVQGFRKIERIARYPGEDTYCGANCRCVVVLWTEDEVRSGAAVSLSTPAGEVSSNPLETNYLPPDVRDASADRIGSGLAEGGEQ